MTSSDEPGTGAHRRQYRSEGIRTLLDHFTIGDETAILTLRNILTTLQQSGFGVLLFVGSLPAFIPIPGLGGAVSGPLAILIGLQMLIGLRNPWLPRIIGERGPQRSSTRRFMSKIAPLLGWLDRLLRPRLGLLLSPWPARMVTGLLIAVTGLLLSLPIPFTNYLFGAILLLFGLALLERDGALMLGCWITSGVCIAVSGVTSNQLLDLFHSWLSHLH